MPSWIELTLWDDSPILIQIEMIVDVTPQYDTEKTRAWVQTVRDTWPVRESFEDVCRKILIRKAE